jgi:hypothetical protein
VWCCKQDALTRLAGRKEGRKEGRKRNIMEGMSSHPSMATIASASLASCTMACRWEMVSLVLPDMRSATCTSFTALHGGEGCTGNSKKEGKGDKERREK